nr:hypothetical protein [Tanacetum cinerariifolium]
GLGKLLRVQRRALNQLFGGQSDQNKNKKRSSSSSSAKPLDQTKKSKLSYAPDSDFQAKIGSKSKSDFDFQANRGSKTKSALKSPLKRNNGKNVSTFESSPQAPKMKERIITPIKDINPMIANMAIKGR